MESIPFYQQAKDTATAGTVYYGESVPGKAITDEVWRIWKEVTASNVTYTVFPADTDCQGFKFAWADRASIVYQDPTA